MSFTSLLAQTVDVITMGPTAEDPHGNPGTGETARTETPARLWMVSLVSASVENITNRDTVAETWQIVLPPSVAIDAGDRVEWDGKTFDVDGAPATVYDSALAHHTEAFLHYSGPVS